MRFRELAIQTQREAPNNARSEGAAFLVRAAYLSRDGELLPLGERAVDHLRTIHEQDGGEFFSRLSMPVLSTAEEIFFPVHSGASEILHCPACGARIKPYDNIPIGTPPLDDNCTLTLPCEQLVEYAIPGGQPLAGVVTIYPAGADYNFTYGALVPNGDTVATSTRTRKARNIQSNPKVSLMIDSRDPAASRGGVVPPRPSPPAREVHLLQRKARKPGAGPGKTTGWIHRTALKRKGVQMLGGVNYERIDDRGLTISFGEKRERPRLLEVDTIVLCAGQEPLRELEAPLRAAGLPVHLVGGADVAAELDAKRAIAQGTRVAAEL